MNITQQTPNDILYELNQPNVIQRMLRQYLASIGQPVDDSLQVVICSGGSTMAITATLYAIQLMELEAKEGQYIRNTIKNQNVTVKSAISPPYYTLHRDITNTVESCEWIEDGPSTIEFVTSPNNPDGRLVSPTNTSKYVIFDSVYDAPQFTGVFGSVNKWKDEYFKSDFICEVDSLSKIGFAGIRFGYIITRNKKIARLTDEYIQTVMLGQNRWANKSFSARFDQLTRRSLYKSLYNTFQSRHEDIRNVIPINLIASDTNVPYVFMNISEQNFDAIGVIVRPGEDFSVSNAYSRLSIMISENEWNELIARLSSNRFQNSIDRLAKLHQFINPNINSIKRKLDMNMRYKQIQKDYENSLVLFVPLLAILIGVFLIVLIKSK